MRAYAVMKDRLYLKAAGTRAVLDSCGRTGCELMATEWNPVCWDAADALQSSMANGLGVVETLFTFAEDGLLAAHFWTHPESKAAARDMFNTMRDDMGDVLLYNLDDMGLVAAGTSWRIYATRDTRKPNQLVIWGLNFSEDQPIEVSLTLVPLRIQSAILKQYGIPNGNTSLTTTTGLAWTQQDVTTGFDSRSFRLPIRDAGVSMLTLRLSPLARADFDCDGDVDQADFGALQTCFTGSGARQLDPACAMMRLDNDSDIDRDDLAIFRNCMSGPGVPADVECG